MVLVASGPQGGGAASGSVGSLTYSHNRFGMYVRNRTIPVNPSSSRQAAVRSCLQQLTDRWGQTVTALQRSAWNTYAANITVKNKLGQDVLLTGFNHYLRSNIARLQASATIIDPGPGIFELPEADPTFAITASEATQQVSFTLDNTLAWANEDDGHLIKFVGLPQNPQRNFFGGPWRLCGTVDGDSETPPSSPDAQDSPWPIVEGQRLWAYARISRADGRLSQPFRADALVGA